MHRRFAALSLFVLAVAACQPGPSTTPATAGPSGSARPGATAGASQGSSGPAEAGVIKGRVTDEQGDPVAGAQIRLTGYTADFNGSDADLVTDASGNYRVEVPDGLFEVFGTATIDFEGGSFVFDLRPADGDCEPQESSAGIVKDLVLQLSGIDLCGDFIDPDNNGSYNGGTVTLLYDRPRSLPADATLEFTLEPAGPLADGSTGSALRFTRKAAALETTFGPLDGTAYLYDIPLGTYRISGTATLPDGTSQQLRFATNLDDAPTESADVTFDPYLMAPYGIRPRDIVVVDADWQPGQ